jgi:hypothetical protein
MRFVSFFLLKYKKSYLHTMSALSIYAIGMSTIIIAVLGVGWLETWSKLRVPSMYPYFADLRTIQGSIDSAANGFNPQKMNPGDPWGRTMNYPSVWFDIAKFFQLSDDLHFLIFGAVIVLSFLLSSAYLVRRFPSAWLLVALFSGSTLLAIERGNNDLLVFFLIFLSLFLPQIFQILVISIAFLLKVYPVFAVLSVALEKRKWWIFLTLLFIVSWVLLPQYSDISSGNSAGGFLSYGLKSTIEIFIDSRYFFIRKILNGNGILFDTFLLVAFLLALFHIIYYRKKWTALLKIKLTNKMAQALEVRMFKAGAGIYCGTFIVSSNWDYRLIFLLLCFPFLQTLSHSLYNKFLPFAMILAMNLWIGGLFPTVYGPPIMNIINTLSKNIIFIFLTILLFQLSPRLKRVINKIIIVS